MNFAQDQGCCPIEPSRLLCVYLPSLLSGTRLLSASEPSLPLPTYPLPTRATFAVLLYVHVLSQSVAGLLEVDA